MDPRDVAVDGLEIARAKITAVFFDLDGTLRHNAPDATAFFYEQADKHGLHSTAERRREAERWTHVYWASSSELLQDLETFGDWNDNGAFWKNHARRHLKVLGASDADAARLAPIITETMLAEYKPADLVPDDVHSILQDIKKSGRTLAVVSNRPEGLGPMLEDLGLAKYFAFSLAAGEVDYWKPDPRLLLHAASIAAVPPQEIVYVGDNYYADVVCARQAGMTPILYDPKGIFSDADCTVISQMRELEILLDDRASPRR